MSVRSSQVLHHAGVADFDNAGVGAGSFLLDRLQSAGASNINVNEERNYELGNFESVDTTRDTPQVTFDLESNDMTGEIEALLLDIDPTSVNDGDSFDFRDATPFDLVSRVKPNLTTFQGEYGLAAPYLALASATYRFGVRASSTKSFQLQGDSYYPVAGTPHVQVEEGDGGTQVFAFDNTPAIKTVEDGDDVYALCVTYIDSDGDHTRLYLNDDFTNTSGAITLLDITPAAGEFLKIVYAHADPIATPQTIHPASSVKPGAVRSRNIKVYVSDGAATPSFERWLGVQNCETTWRVTLEPEEELGNQHYVAQDYDVPEVSGSMGMRARDVAYLYDRIAQITGAPITEIPNILSSTPLEVLISISHPSTGDVMQELYVEDARFQVPAITDRVQQRREVTFNYSSDGGNLEVFQGESGLL